MADDVATVVVPSPPGRRLAVIRCGPADLQPLLDWFDVHLGSDYFFRRGHVLGLLKRGHNAVYWLIVDDQPAGVAIMYRGSILHNLYLTPALRRQGLGSAFLQWLHPEKIRAKTNMGAGDPVPFYQQHGYTVTGCDPDRPWIVEMHMDQMKPPTPPAMHNLGQPPAPAAGPQPVHAAPPPTLVISGPLLASFAKFAKWQLASKRKQLERRELKRQADAQRGAAHVQGPPGWWFDGQRWQQGERPATLPQPGTPQAVPGTFSSLDEVAHLFGDGAQ